MRLAMTRSLRMDSSSTMADNRFDDPARRLADQHARTDPGRLPDALDQRSGLLERARGGGAPRPGQHVHPADPDPADAAGFFGAIIYSVISWALSALILR